MWNPPSRQELETLPEIYSTENVSLEDKTIHLHFFLGGCDWYVAEFDGEDQFFGFVILNGDYENAEWGYFCLEELKAIKVRPGFEIDRDLYWRVRPAKEVDKIKLCRRGA